MKLDITQGFCSVIIEYPNIFTSKTRKNFLQHNLI